MNISSGEGEDSFNATINTTPLVDVMLVLLIVFLIAVPVVLQVKPVRLPNVANVATESKPENVVIIVDKEGNYFLGTKQFTKEEILAKLKEVAPKHPQPEVHIRGDIETRYEFVGRIVAYCQKSGIVKVGFLTLPTKG